MNAIILSIGDELVLGQTVDTNSAWLSRELASIGCPVAAHVTVADELSAIEMAIAAAAARCDVLLISGGLGPTKDDLTRDALARALNQPLEMNPVWLEKMEGYFRRRNRSMSESNRVQAMIPRGAEMIDNSAGTAPGIAAELKSGDPSRTCRVFAMPGVPVEMKTMFERSIKPILVAAGASAIVLSRTLHTFGMGESVIGEMLGELMDRSRNPSVGTTVSGGIVSLRINARSETRAQAEREVEETDRQCRKALGDLIYGSDDQTLATVVGEILARQPIRVVATAESCTGGILAKMITDVPGSSRYFQRGWITYSNQAKMELLNVPADLLQRDGAVSESVVRAMAESARRQSGAEFALAISGIAGPDGGTAAKPVGTVCIALAHPSQTIARTFNFPGNREWVRDRAAKMALTLLRFQLLGRALPF
jgi:nicotinamide-nucleotide amidase